MKIGIVGSSKCPYNADSIFFIKNIIDSYPPDTTFISGGAKGVDVIVEDICELMGRTIIIHNPRTNNWAGFKERNIRIADMSDEVVSVALKYSGNRCYHCNSISHDKTAGCWTMNKCKKGRVVVFND